MVVLLRDALCLVAVQMDAQFCSAAQLAGFVKLGFGVIPVVMWIWCRKREAVLAVGVKHSPTQCSVGFQFHLLSL